MPEKTGLPSRNARFSAPTETRSNMGLPNSRRPRTGHCRWGGGSSHVRYASMAITDSQSVQIGSTQSKPQAVGCDGGKKVKGRKRHILLDTWGLLM